MVDRLNLREDTVLRVAVKPSSELFGLRAVARSCRCNCPANRDILSVGAVGFEPTL